MTTEFIDRVQTQARAEGVPEDLITIMVEHLKSQPACPVPPTNAAKTVSDLRELEALLRVVNLAALTPDFIRASVGYEEARRILQQTKGREGLVRVHLSYRKQPS
jgi:hypothetical protein